MDSAGVHRVIRRCCRRRGISAGPGRCGQPGCPAAGGGGGVGGELGSIIPRGPTTPPTPPRSTTNRRNSPHRSPAGAPPRGPAGARGPPPMNQRRAATPTLGGAPQRRGPARQSHADGVESRFRRLAPVESLTWPRTCRAKHRTAIPVPISSVRGTPLGKRPRSPRRPRGILGSTPHPPEPASRSPPGRTGTLRPAHDRHRLDQPARLRSHAQGRRHPRQTAHHPLVIYT